MAVAESDSGVLVGGAKHPVYANWSLNAVLKNSDIMLILTNTAV